MPPKPSRLNALQAKTLTLLQEIARHPMFAEPGPEGAVVIRMLPDAHGDHFHIGSRVVLGRDATGLHNPSVHIALERKGLIDLVGRDIVLTPAGQAYDTGLRSKILHGSDH